LETTKQKFKHKHGSEDEDEGEEEFQCDVFVLTEQNFYSIIPSNKTVSIVELNKLRFYFKQLSI
jgi:hypothetical protein